MHPLADLLICLRFFSRFPVPSTRRETALGETGFASAAAMTPLAGAVIGVVPASVLLATIAVGLPALLAAPLALAALLLATGCLHEDGLADCADGFGGGRSVARKLEIMRDSRIGAFGACAVALSLYLRATAIGVVAARSPWTGAAMLVAAGALSRSACLIPLVILPPARPDGVGTANRPGAATIAVAVGIAIVVTVVSLARVASPARIGLGLAAAAIGSHAVCVVARRQIGGSTGDVAGAAQQVAEMSFYLAFAGS